MRDTDPKHTKISFILNVMAILIMLYFGIRHIRDEPSWSTSAFMQFGFGIAGLIFIQLISEQPLIPRRSENFKRIAISTGIKSVLIAGFGIVIQLISSVAYSFTILEQAVYFIFSAITEEVFFRGALMNVFFKFDPMEPKIIQMGKHEGSVNILRIPTPTILIGIVVQAVAFTAIHQNYYNDLPMLISVFIGGLMLGLMYALWEDLTANILGHFIINLIAVQNLLVLLSGKISNPYLVVLIFSLFCILVFGLFFFMKKKKSKQEIKKGTKNPPIYGTENIRLAMGKYYLPEQWEAKRKEVLNRKLP